MTSNQSVAAPQVPYQLLSITQAAAPLHGEGTWFRYVIVQGANEITGLRAGSAGDVEFAIREMVERLNERSKGKSAKKTAPANVSEVQVAPRPAQGQP